MAEKRAARLLDCFPPGNMVYLKLVAVCFGGKIRGAFL